jgi:hypothetical protein
LYKTYIKHILIHNFLLAKIGKGRKMAKIYFIFTEEKRYTIIFVEKGHSQKFWFLQKMLKII